MSGPISNTRANAQGQFLEAWLALTWTGAWLRGTKSYRFAWYLTLTSANHASMKQTGLAGLHRTKDST